MLHQSYICIWVVIEADFVAHEHTRHWMCLLVVKTMHAMCSKGSVNICIKVLYLKICSQWHISIHIMRLRECVCACVCTCVCVVCVGVCVCVCLHMWNH